jgi:beta-galactosidase
LCEPEEGRFDFAWLQRAMDVLGRHGLKVVLGTPTSAPPLWLARKHPSILPLDDRGLVKHPGTRRAVCLNSDEYWASSKRIVQEMARALGNHPQLLAWQLDNGIGGHLTEESFNADARRDWHLWLKAKYETLQRLNDLMGLRQWGQVVTDWEEIPMPMQAPTHHNPALALDWRRFCSDTIVQFLKMQADAIREILPDARVTTNLRPAIHRFDHFDVAAVLDFVSVESSAAIRAVIAEHACELDMLRSFKKTDIRAPGDGKSFWVMEQKAGNVNWQDVNAVVRPGVLRMFTYQLLAHGADAVLFFRWRQPRFGNEKFHGAVMPHHFRRDYRVCREIAQIGEEMKLLGPTIAETTVTAEACILYSHENDWALQLPNQPNKHFRLKEHINLFYTALHKGHIPVDFARPTEDLSRYKLVIAPSMHLLAGGEADLLKLYVQNGGTLVATCNTGLVDEHHIAPDSGYPHDLTDLFGLEVQEFDQLPMGEENHLSFKGHFTTSHLHPARLWCDILETRECQVLATYAKDFYAGRAAMTMNEFGLGKAIYIGTMSHQHFYHDLMTWLRQLCNLFPLLKAPDTVEICMREKEGTRIYFLLNHNSTPVRLQFFKPMHDFLTGSSVSGNYDLQPNSVLVLDEHPHPKEAADASAPGAAPVAVAKHPEPAATAPA